MMYHKSQSVWIRVILVVTGWSMAAIEKAIQTSVAQGTFKARGCAPEAHNSIH